MVFGDFRWFLEVSKQKRSSWLKTWQNSYLIVEVWSHLCKEGWSRLYHCVVWIFWVEERCGVCLQFSNEDGGMQSTGHILLILLGVTVVCIFHCGTVPAPLNVFYLLPRNSGYGTTDVEDLFVAISLAAQDAKALQAADITLVTATGTTSSLILAPPAAPTVPDSNSFLNCTVDDTNLSDVTGRFRLNASNHSHDLSSLIRLYTTLDIVLYFFSYSTSIYYFGSKFCFLRDFTFNFNLLFQFKFSFLRDFTFNFNLFLQFKILFSEGFYIQLQSFISVQNLVFWGILHSTSIFYFSSRFCFLKDFAFNFNLLFQFKI